MSKIYRKLNEFKFKLFIKIKYICINNNEFNKI